MKTFIFALLGTAVTFMPGCIKEGADPMRVRICPTITRVTGVHFDRDDRIGLTITRDATPFVENVMMTYDGSEFSAPGLVWYGPRNETSTLTAYYPYREEGQPAEFSIAEDQTQGMVSSDLLAAVKTGVTPASSAVGMLFHHVLSQLTIVVSNASQSQVESVTLSGFVGTAEVDYVALTAVAKAGAPASDVKVFEVTPDATYRAVLVPQQGALTVTVRTADGRSHSKTLLSALLESGKRYDMPLSITEVDIDVTLSGDIEDWIDGGSLGEDSSGDDQMLSYQGEEYRTERIGGKRWMADNLRYVPQGATMMDGVWYPCRNGEANSDAAYIRERGMLYDYATALAGDVAGVRGAGAPVQGICPSGWHIPTLDELTLLADGEYDPATFFSLAGLWNKKLNNYGDESRGYLMGGALSSDGTLVACLRLSRSNPPYAAELAVGNGISLRCVQDDK